MANTIHNVENLIIQNTLEYGSKHGVSTISTLEVAGISGISEYTIFKHFKTKKNLIVSAAEYADRIILNWCVEATNEASNIEEFWDLAMSKLSSNPYAVIYYYKYVTHYGFKDFPGRKESYLECAKHLLKGEHTDDECIKFWDYLSTLIFLYFSKIKEGYLNFGDEDMKTIKSLIFSGINNF